MRNGGRPALYHRMGLLAYAGIRDKGGTPRGLMASHVSGPPNANPNGGVLRKCIARKTLRRPVPANSHAPQYGRASFFTNTDGNGV